MLQFKNLVFEGGGVKGIAYAGALQVLETQNGMPDIKRVAGTSAGAFPPHRPDPFTVLFATSILSARTSVEVVHPS